MSVRSNAIIGCASVVIFVLAAVVEVRQRLKERDEKIRYVTEWIKSETARAEDLRSQGLNTFGPESHVALGESSLSSLREDPRPVIGGLLRAAFDICWLLPLALVASYVVAAVIRHPSRRRIGTLAIRFGLPALCVGIALFLIWIVLVALTLGPLAVPAG